MKATPKNQACLSSEEAVIEVRQNFGFAQLSDRVLLSLEGPDAVSFLQNRLSNDVVSLEIGEGQLNAVLDRQGKIQGVFDLYRTPLGFWLLLDQAEKENAIAQIEKFRLMAQWTLKDVFKDIDFGSPGTQEIGNSPIFTLQGPMAEYFLTSLLVGKLPEKEYTWQTVHLFGLPCYVVRRSLTGESGFLIWPDPQSDFTARQVAEFWDAFKEAAFSGIKVSETSDAVLHALTNCVGADSSPPDDVKPFAGGQQSAPTLANIGNIEKNAIYDHAQHSSANIAGLEMNPETLEILRVEAGLPRYGMDYDFNTLLPETGLEREAVSYTKGCYLGQETIARVKTYGSLPRLLMGLRFEKDTLLPPSGSLCYQIQETPNGPEKPLLGDDSPVRGKNHSEKPVAEIRSGVYSPMLQCPIAFAYIGKEARIPGKKLTVKIHEQIYTVEVLLPPFYFSFPHRDRSEASTQSPQGEVEDLKQAQNLLKKGLALFAEGQDEPAMVTLEQAIAQAPDYVAAHEALGMILSRHNRFQEAIDRMETVLKLDPAHVLAHTNLSVFYMKLGDKEKAEDEKAKATTAAFKQAMIQKGAPTKDIQTKNEQPKDKQTKNEQKASLTDSSSALSSGTLSSQAVEIPSPDQIKDQAQQALLGKVAMFREALKYSPFDPLGNFGLGSAYLSLKRYEEAIPCLENVITHQPKHSAAYLALGKALEAIDQTDKARDIYQKGIEIAAIKGDLMPLKAMQERFESLSGVSNSTAENQ